MREERLLVDARLAFARPVIIMFAGVRCRLMTGFSNVAEPFWSCAMLQEIVMVVGVSVAADRFC